MKVSDDESLFAWTSDQRGFGLFTAHPSYFANSGALLWRPLEEANRGRRTS